MEKAEIFVKDLLTIELHEGHEEIRVKWRGKSTQRKPQHFITPILLKVLTKSGESGKGIILDFRELEYMNSSTITPVIKVLERAKRGRNRLKIIYEKSTKWQDLNFSALDLFQTPDGRVQIEGI